MQKREFMSKGLTSDASLLGKVTGLEKHQLGFVTLTYNKVYYFINLTHSLSIIGNCISAIRILVYPHNGPISLF